MFSSKLFSCLLYNLSRFALRLGDNLVSSGLGSHLSNWICSLLDKFVSLSAGSLNNLCCASLRLGYKGLLCRVNLLGNLLLINARLLKSSLGTLGGIKGYLWRGKRATNLCVQGYLRQGYSDLVVY